jgi:hypothetical protein
MPNPAELASRAERAANQLRDWLIEGPAQQADGGVAGVVDASGGCRYVYGEITGYYLHWLAQARSVDPQRRRERAARALTWVEAHYHQALAPTRLTRDSGNDDWRNAAQFLFDLAMLAGGLAQATRAGLIAPDANRMGALANAFDHFVVDGQLRACLWLQPERAPLPRWSTAGGPFLAKAASRALMAEALFPFASAFSSACRNTLQAVNMLGINSGIGMLHPTLYAMEGAVADHTANEAALRRWLATMLALQDTADGSLPETPGVVGAKRSDVMAQALRLGATLDLADHVPEAAAALSGLASALIARVRDNGIAFDPAREPDESNVWCAMFAEQALRAHAARLRGAPVPFAADEIV